MPSGTIYATLFSPPRKGLFVLLDPDRIEREAVPDLVRKVTANPMVRAILIGTSLLITPDFRAFVQVVKAHAPVPVILFPGSELQVAPEADAIFFLSLLSGRNPELLIGELVKMAPLVHAYNLEAIPVAYLLVESGGTSSVEFMSNTRPLPRNKPDIAVAHALAAWYLGFQAIYLEAGSGAPSPVPPDLIRAIREVVPLPLIVGGGLRSQQDIRRVFDSGGDFAVIGTAIERDQNFLLEVGL